MRKIALISAVGLIVVGSATSAQERLTPECRREFVQLCGADRAAMRECIREKADQLSASCKTQLQDRMAARRTKNGGNVNGARSIQQDTKPATEYGYGSSSLQKLDFWAAKKPNAPLVIFVHGGGWKSGDKSNETGRFKAAHYLNSGYAFASINYRLVPDATVEQQATDVARSVAWLRSDAARLGFDPSKVILMGHSAGAHLVALVGTDPQYLHAAGLSFADLRGVIPLDGACYDVPSQMEDGPKMMHATYKQAFGNDPIRQKDLSPTLQAASPNAPAFLILHVNRDDGKRQSETLMAALKDSQTDVSLFAVAGDGLKGHMEINRRLGDPGYPATAIIDKWLAERFANNR
jgi:arylformamidase